MTASTHKHGFGSSATPSDPRAVESADEAPGASSRGHTASALEETGYVTGAAAALCSGAMETPSLSLSDEEAELVAPVLVSPQAASFRAPSPSVLVQLSRSRIARADSCLVAVCRAKTKAMGRTGALRLPVRSHVHLGMVGGSAQAGRGRP